MRLAFQRLEYIIAAMRVRTRTAERGAQISGGRGPLSPRTGDGEWWDVGAEGCTRLGASGEAGVVKVRGSPSDDVGAGAMTIDVGSGNAGPICVGARRSVDVVDSIMMKGTLDGRGRAVRSEE